MTIIKGVFLDRKNYRFTDLPIENQKKFYKSFYNELSKLKIDIEKGNEDFEKKIETIVKEIQTENRVNIICKEKLW